MDLPKKKLMNKLVGIRRGEFSKRMWFFCFNITHTNITGYTLLLMKLIKISSIVVLMSAIHYQSGIGCLVNLQPYLTVTVSESVFESEWRPFKVVPVMDI